MLNMLNIGLTLTTFMALFPIANPFSTAPVFLAITQGDSEQKRAKQVRMAIIYMFAILVVFLVAGTMILNFFGISIPGLRIAGGIMIARIAMSMLTPSREDEQTQEEEEESVQKRDVSFTPMAMPSLSGPGAIAVTIGLTSLAEHWWDYASIIFGIFVVCLICFFVLRGATKIVKFLGANGMNAMTKIMGFLLLCVGIQFIVNGITGIVTDVGFLQTLVDVVNNLPQTPGSSGP